VLDDAFERNKNAFYAGYTPDPNHRGPKRFQEYLNKEPTQKQENRINTSTSSYNANKARFFGFDLQ
jgi:hypothetical protein